MNPRLHTVARTLLRPLLCLAFAGTTLLCHALTHPGALHTAADFTRMTTKVNASAQPWKSDWDVLVANSHSSSSYVMQGPVPIVYRGTGTPENYSKLFNDIAAAYQNALRWKIAGDTACGNKAVQIMNAWSSTLTSIQGTSDRFLAAGLYGYEFCQAAEIMRSYSGWAAADFTAFKNMMLNIFYPMNHDFLVNHNGACISHYWCNWDACNMCSVLAIGILCDDTAKFNEAINYFKTGAGNGAIDKAVFFVHPGNLGQGQEAGRDQGHATLNISLLGAFCQMAYNQGTDLFAWENNKFFTLCEYTAKYNLFQTVPYTTYNNCDNVNQTVISSNSQGNVRPCWELVFNHYVNVKGLSAPFSAQWAAQVRPEGGGGNYGPNSGGYDQLGFGTLTCTLDLAGGLPPGWSDGDIGSVGTAGSGTFASGVYTVKGSGSDIGGTGDSGNFLHQSRSGDNILIARVASQTIGGSANDKVGLAMRAGTASGDVMAVVLLDASSGKARFARRTATGGSTTWTDGGVFSVPVWFKLQRSGSTFTGSVSTDGATWTQVGSASVTMNSSIQVGLIVCSRDTALDTSVLDNIQ